MAKEAAGGISPDAAFSSIQGQLSGMQGQLSGMGQEIGEIRQDVAETNARTKSNSDNILEVKAKVQEIDKALHGNSRPGLYRRMDRVEHKIQNPNATSANLPAQSAWRILKWQTIKDLGSKSYKIAIVLLLISLGYREVAKSFLGVPDIQQQESSETAPVSPSPPTTSP